MTEQHSKDEKERKGTKKKNLEGKRGLQKLTEKGEGALCRFTVTSPLG